MAGNANKAAALLKDAGVKARATGTKIHSLAMDPDVQAKAKKLLHDGKNVYRVATSPEAKQAYHQVSKMLKKALKK